MIFPSGEYQDGRVAFECLGENLCTLYTKTDSIIFNRGKRGLRNTCAIRELILAQALQLTHDAHGLAHRHGDAFLRGTELTHLRLPIVMGSD